MIDVRATCANCPHTEAEHNAGDGCGCEKFVYGPVPLQYALLRFATELKPGASRDTLSDALNDIFGRRYSREMKGLMREAFKEGLTRAGIGPYEVAGLVDEKGITKLWQTQGRYTTKIKNDLRASIESGAITSADTLKGWFDRNDWRSVMTGRFMAWQGVNMGIARASWSRGNKLRWTLGDADHCETCLSRQDHEYTYDELVAIGPPGSYAVECKSNCKCVLVEVA